VLQGGLALTSGAVLPSLPAGEFPQQLNLDPELIHLGGLLIASHPMAVREAIERHRRGLDENPVRYLLENGPRLRQQALDAAARYWGTRSADVALTDSTTMGLGTLYNGLELAEGEEALTTEHDHYATQESLRLMTARSGATLQKIGVDRRPEQLSEDSLTDTIVDAIGPKTRVLALTWVHSDVGVRLPLARIASRLQDLNAKRDEGERILLCADGVHGFGVLDENMTSLGCDFFVAGCHKWLLGPRGTGVIYGSGPRAWKRTAATIPAFGPKDTPGKTMSPGGFHSFEHRWALSEAFELHLREGKARIAEQTMALATQLKEGLSAMNGVTLHTPLDPKLSAGIVSFDLEGLHPNAVVQRLLAKGIVLTRAPYGPRSVRATPMFTNTAEEIELTLGAIRSLI
jgi:isopenicillin-N epimerase